MMGDFPSSVLFCCDHNAVRSPMAEALMKKFYGQRAYVQSAGVHNDMEIDGFSVAVCREIGMELARHRSRSFDEMQRMGDDLSQFDLVVALSPSSQRAALAFTKHYHLAVEYWPIPDPTAIGDGREAKLAAYRHARNQIRDRILTRFGQPTAADPAADRPG
ncbi:MAG: low molecular weight phosphatase family protein [Alphaproteobacteria bacterium]